MEKTHARILLAGAILVSATVPLGPVFAQDAPKPALSEPLRGALPVPKEDAEEQKAIDQVTDSVMDPSKQVDPSQAPLKPGKLQTPGPHHAVVTNTAKVIGKETRKGAESLGKGVEVVGRDTVKGAGVVGRDAVKGVEVVGRDAVK